MLLMFKIPSKCAENAAWGETQEGEVRGCERGRGGGRRGVGKGEGGGGGVWGGLRGVEERVINHVWVTHNEI